MTTSPYTVMVPQNLGSTMVHTRYLASQGLTLLVYVTCLLVQPILGDLDIVAGVGTGAGLLAKIKNTMSDCHIVQKKFNSLLEEYCSEILPSIISDWKELSIAGQDQFSSLNNFFLWYACPRWHDGYCF